MCAIPNDRSSRKLPISPPFCILRLLLFISAPVARCLEPRRFAVVEERVLLGKIGKVLEKWEIFFTLSPNRLEKFLQCESHSLIFRMTTQSLYGIFNEDRESCYSVYSMTVMQWGRKIMGISIHFPHSPLENETINPHPGQNQG